MATKSNKTNTQSLLPDIPEVIRAARIGTCFNSMTRKLMDKKIAIDINRLSKNMVLFVNGKGTLRLKMNSNYSLDSQDTFFALDSKVKANFLFGSISLGYNMQLTTSSMTSGKNLSCFCSYIYSGQKLQLLYNTKELYNSMTDEFQDAYTKVVKSKTAKEYMINHSKFVNLFGYGCVTDLYLTSGSAFLMKAYYKDEGEASKSKYGGSIGVSTAWGGGSVASEFAKEVSNVSSNAEMELIAEQIPEDTPTKNWCDSTMNTVMAMGFTELAKSPNAIKAYDAEGPKAPDIPDGNPTKKEIPTAVQLDITDEVKQKIMDEDDFKGTWKEYKEAQEKAYNELNASKINNDIVSNNKLTCAKYLDKCTEDIVLEINANKSSQCGTRFKRRAGAGARDLGGYLPFAYKITSWNELFPELKGINIATTFTSIYIAKIYIYYLTRLQFASYLYFLADVGTAICKNDNIKIDADIYSNLCKEFLNNIEEIINNNCKITEEHYNALVYVFENRVKTLRNFESRNVYETFFNKYEFFMENPYGFITVHKPSNSYFINDGKKKAFPRPFSITSMLKDANRSYPVIRNDGELIFAAYDSSAWRTGSIKIIGDKKRDKNGFYYYEIEGGTLLYYGVGFEDIPKNSSNFTINGMGMFEEIDFADVKEFAKPRFD